MATYYWVGGAGTWNTSTTTNWASSSGGSGGAGVPLSTDSVILDSSSGTGTITCTAGVCLDLTVTATQALILGAASSTLSVYGSFTGPASGSFSSSTNSWTITFAATTTGKTITTNNARFQNLTFNGAGGAWTLGSALTIAGVSPTTVTAGTFDTGNFNITGYSLISSGTGVRTINLGSSAVSLAAQGGLTALNFAVTTNLTFNAGTSTITFTGSQNWNVSLGGQTFYNVVIASGFTSSNYTGLLINGSATFNNLTFTRYTAGNYAGFGVTAGATLTVTGTLNFGTSSGPTQRVALVSQTQGSTFTISAAAVSNFTDVDFRDCAATGAASWSSGTRISDLKGNTGITFSTPKTVYWNLAGAQNWTATGWAATSGGSPAANNFPLAQDTAVFDNTGSAGTISLASPSFFPLGTVDMSARSTAMTLSLGTGTGVVYGNWLNGTGTTISVLQVLTFSGRTTQTITSAGQTFSGATLIIDSPGGTVQLADAFASAALNLTNGTFNANGQAVSVSTVNLSSGTKTLIMGTGTWTLTASSVGILVWDMATNAAGLTFSGASAPIVLSNVGATTRTFNAGTSLTYNSLTIGPTTSTSTLTITGTTLATFTAIARTGVKTAVQNITLGVNLSVGDWTYSGGAGSLANLNSIVSGTQRTLTKTGGGQISVDYLSIRDMAGIPATNTWYVGANSVNVSNNTGLIFTAAPNVVIGPGFTIGPGFRIGA